MKIHVPTKHPELWRFFEENARNVMGTDVEKYGKYRIPKPDRSGMFLYADDPKTLLLRLKEEWFKPSFDSPSIRGKIQAIVRTF